MGDGGVACMPLQRSSNNIIMEERFPVQEKNTTTTVTAAVPSTTTTKVENVNNNSNSSGGGGSNNKNNNNNVSSGDKKDNGKSNSSNNGVTGKVKKVKRIVKVKKVVRKVVVAEKKGVGLVREVKSACGSGSKEVVVLEKKESGLKKEEKSKEVTAEKKESGWKKEVAAEKKESGLKISSGGKTVENGDGLGSGDAKLQSGSNNIKEEVEEGELGTLKWPPKGEIENGEFVPIPEKPRRSEIERGEIGIEKWKKGDIEKGEIVSGNKWQRGEVVRDEIEKGEFIPDRWNGKDEYGYIRSRGRYDMSRERTPPSGKYSCEDFNRRKELTRSGGSLHSKSSMRWESGQERSTRISSKIVDEEGSYKSEYSNGKNPGREYSSGNRLKRHCTDSDSTERKHYGDYSSSKSRRLSEDGSRYAYSEHYSRHSVERFYKNSSSSRVSLSDKYSSRHHESTLPSKVVYDRHVHSDWSPHERPRYNDHRDRSPIRHEKSPYGRERTPYGLERSPYGRERSPYGRERSPCWRDRSPYGHDRSPYGREKSPYGRERSPYGLEKSPYERSRHYEHRKRSPSYVERSPQDRARHHDRSDRTPNCLERSPHDRAKPNNYREASRKGGATEKRNSQYGNKQQEDKISQKDPDARDTEPPAKESQDKSSVLNLDGLDEKNASSETRIEEKSESPRINIKEPPQVDGPPPEELQSMEEDMDICDTPPHVPAVADTSTGKWFYLDHFGVECGPSKLCELKALVDEGSLMSDHFIKHLHSDRWLTIENALSPFVPVNFPSVVPDAITQLVSPPEAPGNLLADTGDIGQSGAQIGEGVSGNFLKPPPCPDHSEIASESLEDLQIDERVGALLEGFSVVPGSELETVGEALQMTFEHVQWEGCIKAEGFTWQRATASEQQDENSDELQRHSDVKTNVAVEAWPATLADKDDGFASSVDSTDWFSGRWSCKGGDWKRNEESVQDRCTRRKLVLNDGFPVCHMPKSGCEDPRWHIKDDLYNPSQSRKLDLPPWAFSSSDDRNDTGGVSRSTLNKPPITRGVKGTVLPVVRINTCVVQDHVSETRTKVRGKDRYHSRSVRTHSATNDVKSSSVECDSQSRVVNDQDSHGCWKSTASLNTPKDRLCTADDLQLNLGDWYYLDGSGHERGPLSFSELQNLADKGTIQKYSSVFRKFDRVWVPVASATETSEAAVRTQQSNVELSVGSSGTLLKSQTVANIESNKDSSSFHSLHPQFIGFTRGKLHELVMKSYKNREFAVAINEALDPWIVAKQPQKELDKHMYLKSEIDVRVGKRAWMQPDQIVKHNEMEEDTVHKVESTFEQLCGDTNFHREESMCSEIEAGSWGLLDGHMLARIFHFLRSDLKSLVFASLTCKQWRAAVSFYKGISIQVDLSSVGRNCTDLMVRSIMNGYNKEKINAMVLTGCTNVTSGMLEEILRSFPCLSSIDIRGCTQFMELAHQFPRVSWLKSRTRILEESNSKLRSLKQISGRDDFGELKEYFDSVNKRDSANQLFRRSLYKRSKVFDARKSSSILSRDARMRRWAVKKSENSYTRMEGFLAAGLKDIMKENIFDFFVPKVAEIEDRMKNGYYVGHGLRSVKEDISRMCRDAIKVKNRGAGDMNHIITLFFQLASRLEESSKFSYERDELTKSWKDDLSAALDSAPMKHKKKATGKKYMNRSNGTIPANGSFDYGEYASDQEIKKRISKLNRKSMDSGSETSDDRSSEDGRSGSDSTASDTESDLDFRSEGRTGESRGDGYCMTDEDEREWGARMTKVSLVPPVTRKYEVIDQYLIVADEEDVQRKMSVSLPDDYAEKLDAQKNGTEELDMELPEVKDYKPRKQLGDEVIEQEVYGIDPYTHNLLLDSMPEEVDWPLLQKHMFIEDVLLCALNKQVRHFTGAGNTPMTYPIQPVVEEIEQAAMEDCDIRKMKICRGILRAIDSRPDDKYVAYRKGLGVVCNKEGGFGDDDFVVEFLGEVYPAWKWFEKQDGIRLLQKDSKEPAPEFYNIYLERPKGDADGYDLVVVDAMHKANYASRICHSCKPNCEAKVTAVEGQYQIGIYTVREIQHGEEITFDYNSVTESKEEYEASVCLCGSQVCRGSYLNLTGEGAFQKVLKEWHGLLDRHYLMLGACELNSVSEEDYLDLGRAGLGSCLLGGLPDWVVAYSARLVRFINLERTKLPEEILRHNLEEKRKYFADTCLEVERSDAEVQAEGVYNQRLQNLAVTLDKCMSPYMDEDMLNDLKSKVCAHDPSDCDDIQKALQKSLLWLRDEVRSLPCTYKCRHDAAADLIHVYAYTKSFFRVREYDAFTSPPVHISPLDLGPKCADKLGGLPHKYQKTYGGNYCMGQLIFWHVQTNTEPDFTLAKASKGCLSLPEIGSFYAKVQKPSQQRIYGPKTVKMMLERMEKYPQKPWPKDQIWSFKNSPRVFGSPMLDAVLNNAPLDREMVHWLKHRPTVYQAIWDR
uniref:Putative histone-lysine N-methyltransferase ATXR3 isoform X1 n=1 Tax=Populus alba TaxID=43335 RepID=A0A4U5P496_POPAL|nr:putative histone-lysine N-methyltransferase ATXR3 isoform X1 [Populus alba]